MSNVTISKFSDNTNTGYIAPLAYFVSTSLADASAKTATSADSIAFTNTSLVSGITVWVKFTYPNMVYVPTLKIGTSTAKTVTGDTYWNAGDVVSFTYDGTNWCRNGEGIPYFTGTLNVSFDNIRTGVSNYGVITLDNSYTVYRVFETIRNYKKPCYISITNGIDRCVLLSEGYMQENGLDDWINAIITFRSVSRRMDSDSDTTGYFEAILPSSGQFKLYYRKNVIYGSSTNSTTNALAKFKNTNGEIIPGPTLGSSTTTFLRNDGTWAAPTGLVKVYNTSDIVYSVDSLSSAIVSGKLNQYVIDDIIADSDTHQVVIIDNNYLLTGSGSDEETNHFIVTSDVNEQDSKFYAISTSYIFHAYYYSGHELFEIYEAPAPSHSHGSITNEGTILASNTSIATGDRLLVRRSSGGYITSSPIILDTNSEAYLKQNGTWLIPSGLVNSWGSDELGISATTPSAGLIMEGTVNQGTFDYLNVNTYYYVCMITDADGEFTACPNLNYYFYEITTESSVQVLNYISYDATNSRFVLLKIKDNDTFTISEISTSAQGDFVRYDTNALGLTTTEQGNARTNIAAAASSHTHGNITNDGKIGTTANYAVYTTTGGALTASAALPTTITNATIAALPTWTAVPTDTTYLIRQDTGGSNSFGRVTFSTVNSYIKSKNPVLNYVTYDSTEDAIKFVFPS